jgi:N6-L-threonylcarbamoyladenine synthase
LAIFDLNSDGVHQKASNINILAIESSCDDTAASVIVNDKIRSNIVSSQAGHQPFGGVVPELASRNHQQNIVPVVDAALKKAQLTTGDLSAIAFTQGPGLMGSLLVGYSFAKSTALAMNVPLIAVNHLQAHVFAHFIEPPYPKFPFLCLLVSGGHTQLIVVQEDFSMEVIGHSIDDAAGEAFDKTAKLLGLGYPGGPVLDKLARKGNPDAFVFSKAKVDGYNYSFSGLKTSVLYFLRNEIEKNPNFIAQHLNDLCASVQKNIVSYLMEKLTKAAENLGISHIGIAGGVSANSLLREVLQKEGMKRGWETFIPAFEYCTDNAAMIARAAQHLYNRKIFATKESVPFAKYKIDS